MRENRPSGSEAGVALIPPSLPLSNASRPRRCPRSRGSAWTAAACRRCVRWPGWNGVLHRVVAIGLGWKPAFQRDVTTTGGSRALVSRAGGGPVPTGNSGRAGWFSFGSPSSGGTIGVRNGGSEGLGRGTGDASCAQDPCPFPRTAQFGARAMEEALLGLETLWLPSAGACCARTAAPPRGP